MRLIDLHVDWLLQYANESVVFDPTLYAGAETRQGQASGYLQACRAAILSCFRRSEDWAGQSDPWRALGELITRIEAEFSGRLLIGPDDFDRWEDDRDGMAWGLIGIEGFDALVRSADDLPRVSGLFDRGVRLFQPVYTEANVLAGSSVVGDERGLTDLGYVFLETLLNLSDENSRPRPIFDLAHLNQRATSDVLEWFSADPDRLGRVLLVYSHGAPAHPGFDTPRALSIANVTRLRELGGIIGLGISPPFFQTSAEIKQAIETIAAIPFQGRLTHEGIAVGTDFLGVNQTLTGLSTADEVVDWFQSQFDRGTAKDLLHDNALSLIARSTGGRRSGG